MSKHIPIVTSVHGKTLLFAGVIALVVTVGTMSLYSHFVDRDSKTIQIEHVDRPITSQVGYTLDDEGKPVPLDFTEVAAQVMHAVVHIKSVRGLERNRQASTDRQDPMQEFFRGDPFEDLFGRRFFYRHEPPQNRPPQPQVGQGSGVIISPEGYIVTNNHVIADADELEVTLHDNRSYEATIVGTDPTTDLALLRIHEDNLTTVDFTNSDEVRVGEWVLAVGNPFNLTSTVTAGIVSAKGRNINLLRERFAVESFIQTDAAINPGNSGGALVNLDGDLVGINTAIASPTGAYSGYGFAVPANIVSKVVDDLKEYGVVQRGVLGIMIRTVNGNLQREMDLSVTEGAYVDSLLDESAAARAGIKPGDVIVAIDGRPIVSSPGLQEVIARHRPGDSVKVTINRKGRESTYDVVLKNREGKATLVKREHKEILNVLGANLEPIDAETAEKLNVQGGVRVTELFAGKLRRETDIREGFIITKVDGKAVKTVDALAKILEGKKGGIMMEGVYEDRPGNHYHAFGL